MSATRFCSFLHLMLLGFVVCNVALADPNETLLPPQYKVYFKEGSGVANQPFTGATEKTLPTKNEFKGKPGCYVACYSRSPIESVYNVSKGIYVMGQIRVEGSYVARLCQPKGFENKDISKESSFRDKCATNLPHACGQSKCWGGGDTGGWFGIQ